MEFWKIDRRHIPPEMARLSKYDGRERPLLWQECIHKTEASTWKYVRPIYHWRGRAFGQEPNALFHRD